jgi:hypothetical protein
MNTAEQERDDQVAEVHRERVDPGQRRLDRAARRMAAVDLDERDHREQPEDEDLGAEQRLLDARRELDAAVADPGHQRDPQDRGDDDRGFGFAEFGEAEELEGVDRRDVRQRGHHDQVREEDRPAVHPARHRTEARASSRRTSCPRRGRRG